VSQKRTMQTVRIPTLTGGTNLRDAKMELQPNESNLIYNYYCFPNKLKAMGSVVSGVTLAATTSIQGLHNWNTATPAETLIATTNSRVYSIAVGYTATNITGGVAMTNGLTSAVPFGGYLFIANGTNPIIRVSLAQVTSAAAFVGPGGVDSTLSQVWSYKGRLYFIEANTTKYWYGGLLSVTGALTSIDLNSILFESGVLLFGAAWTSNQGIGSEEFCVFVSTTGEILVYSGDYPGSPNWQLTGRTKIPAPQSGYPYKRFGSDLLIYTKAGIIKLSDAFAAASGPASVFTITDKISTYFQKQGFSTISAMANHATLPFTYVAGLSGNKELWAVNYQTGAWSKLTFAVEPQAIAHAFGQFQVANGADIYRTNVTNRTNAQGRGIQTGYMNFGSMNVKRIIAVRWMVSISEDSGSPLANTYSCLVDAPLEESDGNSANIAGDTVTTTMLTTGRIATIEFRPGIAGVWFSFALNAQNVSDFGAMDEVYGCEVDYEEGGFYK